MPKALEPDVKRFLFILPEGDSLTLMMSKEVEGCCWLRSLSRLCRKLRGFCSLLQPVRTARI